MSACLLQHPSSVFAGALGDLREPLLRHLVLVIDKAFAHKALVVLLRVPVHIHKRGGEPPEASACSRASCSAALHATRQCCILQSPYATRQPQRQGPRSGRSPGSKPRERATAPHTFWCSGARGSTQSKGTEGDQVNNNSDTLDGVICVLSSQTGAA